MRLVDRQAFLTLPAGTVFQKFEPHCFGPVCIKGDNAGENDWWEVDISGAWPEGCGDSGAYFDALDQMVAGSETETLDFETVMRDGLYDEGQMFAVWSKSDLAALTDRLREAQQALGEE